ncbi:hypothetical protein J3F83DRAFT_632214 [Trichoderma novae-zelandiae]
MSERGGDGHLMLDRLALLLLLGPLWSRWLIMEMRRRSLRGGLMSFIISEADPRGKANASTTPSGGFMHSVFRTDTLYSTIRFCAAWMSVPPALRTSHITPMSTYTSPLFPLPTNNDTKTQQQRQAGGVEPLRSRRVLACHSMAVTLRLRLRAFSGPPLLAFPPLDPCHAKCKCNEMDVLLVLCHSCLFLASILVHAVRRIGKRA